MISQTVIADVNCKSAKNPKSLECVIHLSKIEFEFSIFGAAHKTHSRHVKEEICHIILYDINLDRNSFGSKDLLLAATRLACVTMAARTAE